MAPVTAKRKRPLPLLPSCLDDIQRQIEKFQNKPAELLKVMNYVLEMDAPWPYEKGDLLQWSRILDLFDGFLGSEFTSEDLIVSVLKFTRLILENCGNRQVYNSYEHLKRLIEHRNCDIIMGVLKVLSVLATPRSTRQIVSESEFMTKLSSLASSSFCSQDNSLTILQAISNSSPQGTFLKMSFYRMQSDLNENDDEGPISILMDIKDQSASDEDIFQKIMSEYKVPDDSHFALKTRIRMAQAFTSFEQRLQWIRVQIMATTVFAQCQSVYNMSAMTNIGSESRLSELIEVLQQPDNDLLPLDIETLSLKALTALLSERSKQSSSVLASTAASHAVILSSMIRRAKNLILEGNTSPTKANVTNLERLKFGEALLAFTWMFSGSNNGNNALNSAGIMHLILPMLQDHASRRGRFITLAVKTVEVMMNYSNEMQQSFKEMNGLSILVDRADAEVKALLDLASCNDTEMVDAKGDAAGEESVKTVEGDDNSACFVPFIPHRARLEENFERCRLLGAILHLLSSAASPVASSSDVREFMSGEKVPKILCTIFERNEIFGASVFEKAAGLLTEFVHQEPSCLQLVISNGIAKAALKAVSEGFPISRGSVSVIPTMMGALCLSSSGSQLLEQMQPIGKFMDSICSERTIPVLQGETPCHLGNQLEELMRHNPSLLDACMKGCVNMANKIPIIMGRIANEHAMQDGSHWTTREGRASNNLTAEAYLLCSLEFLGKLLDPLMSASEHARSFVRNKGIDAVLKLISSREIPQDFSKSEAGKYIILVIGKTAFHSSGSVLEEVIRRTQSLLDTILSRIPLPGVMMEPVLSDSRPDSDLLSLEIHVNLLSGIFGCLRGSSTAAELDNERGIKLIRDIAECYVRLSCQPNTNTVESDKGEAQTMENESPGARSAVDTQGQSNEEPLGDWLSDNAPEAEASLPTERRSNTNTRTSLKSEVTSAISHLFVRLSTSLSSSSRRRQDDRNAQHATHERALSKNMSEALQRVLTIDVAMIRDVDSVPRAIVDSLVTASLCLFGSQAMPFLLGDSQRPPARNSANTVLLQGFITSKGMEAATNLIGNLVESVLETRHVQEKKLFEAKCVALVKSISFCKRVLETQWPSNNRSSSQPGNSNFDYKSHNVFIKVEMHNSLMPLWTNIRSSAELWPKPLVSSVIDIYALLMKPEENNPTEGRAETASTQPQRSFAHDPATVSALVEMGFDERRVHMALDVIQTNSIQHATEWLFMNSEIGVEDEESEIARALALSMNQASSQSESQNAGVTANSSDPNVSHKEKVQESSNDQSSRANQSEYIRANAVEWCVGILGAGNRVEFACVDMLSWLCKNDKKQQESLIQSILNAIQDSSVKPDGLSRLILILAILVSENSDLCTVASNAGSFKILSKFLCDNSSAIEAEQKPADWICSCLLVLNKVLANTEKNKALDLREVGSKTEDVSQGAQNEKADPKDDEVISEHATLMRFCIGLLQKDPEPHLLQAILDVCARLTRHHSLASIFFHEGAVERLLSIPKRSSYQGQAVVTGSIIRHVLEDSHSLQASMVSEIRSILSSMMARNNGKNPTLKAFLSSSASLVQRDANTFAKAIKSCCKLVNEDGRKLIAILDKKEDKTHQDYTNNDVAAELHRQSSGGSISNLQKGKGSSRNLTEVTNTIVSLLINKLLADPRIKNQPQEHSIEKSSELKTTADASCGSSESMQLDKSQGEKPASTAKNEELSAITPVNILRYLADIVKFYPGCAQMLLKYTIDSSETKGDSSQKSNETFVQYLLRELLPHCSPSNGKNAQKSIKEVSDISRRSTSLVISLLSRGSEVRKKVLTEIVCVLNSSTRSRMTGHLLMLQSISDILNTLVTAKVHPNQTSNEPAPETIKLLQDCKVPQALCKAVASMDLHHPNASRASTSILRPLEVICANAYQSDKASVPSAKKQGGNSDSNVNDSGTGQDRNRNGDNSRSNLQSLSNENQSMDMEHEIENDHSASRDEEMHDQGSVNDDMRGSDEEDSDEEEEEEEEEEDEDTIDDDSFERFIEDDEDRDSQGQDDEYQAILEGDREEEPFLTRLNRESVPEIILNHHAGSQSLSRHDLNNIMEQLVENESLIRDEVVDVADVNGMEVDDQDAHPQHVFSFLMSGNRDDFMGGRRMFHDMVAIPSLHDMPLLRFPSRALIERGILPGGRNTVPNHEALPSEHPLLTRHGDRTRSRSSASDGDREGADNAERGISRRLRTELIFGGIGSRSMGRVLVGDQAMHLLGRQNMENNASATSRWTDDGRGSSQAMRNMAIEMEDTLASFLMENNAAEDPTSRNAALPVEGSDPSRRGATSSADNDMEEDNGGNVSTMSIAHERSVDEIQQVDSEVTLSSSIANRSDAMEEDDNELQAALQLSLQSDESSGQEMPTETMQDAPSAEQQGPAEIESRSEAADAEKITTEPASGNASAVQPNEPSPSASTQNVDADSAGIDPTFLAELPEDLRAEVMQQQMNRNAAAQLASTAASSIDPEFLAALPPDIQADVIRQHQREEQQNNAVEADTSRSQDMDNASFIATLSQELREEVLLTSDDAFLATLPPHLVAEAALLRERENDFGRSLHHSFGMSRRQSQNTSSRQEPARAANNNASKPQAKKLMQVIDEGSVTYILKLLFLVQPVTKALMNKILLHIAAHEGTRDVAVRFLLSVILQSCDQNSKHHEMYGYSANNAVSDAFVPITICRRAVEALCHLAMYQNEVCKTMLKDDFLEDRVVKDFQKHLMPKLQFLDKTDLTPDKKAISSLISFLATETATKSIALQEQVLQLLNTAVQFVEKTLEEETAETKPTAEGTKFSMPKVNVLELHCLTQTLTASGNSSKCMERLTSLFKSLSCNPINLVACISHLIAEVKGEGEKSKVALELFLRDCKESKNMSLETFIGEQDYKLLRLVKMLRSLWPTKSSDTSAEDPNTQEMLIDTVSRRSLGEAVELQDLWHLLGECLSMLERTESNTKSTGHGSLSPALCRMQPLFEAFLVVKAPDSVKNASSSKNAGKSSSSMDVDKAAEGECSPGRNPSALNVKEFVSFAEQHRHTLNMYIRQDKSLLHSIAFAPLVRYPKLLDFDNKKHFFRSELKKRNVSQRYNSIRINVRRDYVFEDSFHQIVLRKPDELKGRLTVTFNGEEGVDAGGLTREWYLILSKQMLNPDKALFIHSANGLTYQPNPASTIQPDHLKYFKFAGQIVGKAIWDEQLLDSHFTLSMYKHMLNQPIEYTDVESIDPEYFRNLGWMLNNDITDILEETFSIVREQFGEMLTIDLKPNGRNVPVTEENKHEYVQLVAEQQMTKGIKEQIDAFKEGFHQLMPPDLISIFTCAELELLMCGLPTIDVQDLRLNTEYTGYTRESPQIQWFWNIVQTLSQEDLARLLQFVTGTSQVPMDGFKALRGMNGPQKFNIHRCGDKKRLPSSHTCFNQLDLPEYSSEEELSKYLLSAVREGFEGFGFS